jgi:hypothetical protein
MIFRRHTNIEVQTESQKEYSGTEVLLDAEEGLAKYNRDVVKKISSGLGINPTGAGNGSNIVEFGAGTGALAEVWRELFDVDPICVEIDPTLIKILQIKGFETVSDVQDISSKTSFLYTANVLEHIDDDVKALKMIRESMEPGGKIAIYVPALPILFSDLDRKVGHFRRYKRKELIHKVMSAGYEVQNCYFNDSVGVLASLVLKVVGYKNKAGLGSKKSLLFYDRYVYPISKVFDRIFFRNLIGKNLFLFATVPQE